MENKTSYPSTNATARQREQFFTNNPSSTSTIQMTKPSTALTVLNTQMNGNNGTDSANNHHAGGHRSPAMPTPTTTTTTMKETTGPSHHQTNGTTKGVTIKELHGYVGFANIPNQVYRKAIKRGFDFTFMVVGQSGLGKSTFINSLFLTDFYSNTKNSTAHRAMAKTTQIEENTVRLVENGVSLVLTLVDTPGFGEAVDNSNCWDAIVQYVDRKSNEFFNEETKVNRKEKIPDHRVHCCLYFIAPSGHGLKPLDIEFMKHLHDRVNIIPVIAKADTLTPEELAGFKQRISKEIEEHKIRIYDFPDPDDETEKREQKKMKQRVPFAVIGSNTLLDVNGKKVRCRKYPWGIVEVENLEHNDFVALRNMIIRTNMIDLIEMTRCVHYENFRCRQLMLNGSEDPMDKHPFTTMDDQKKEHDLTLKKKEAEMERVLQEKVKEKFAPLIKKEKELEAEIKENERVIAEKRRNLAERRQKFEQEKLTINQQYPEFHKYTSTDSLDGKDGSKKSKKKFGRL